LVAGEGAGFVGGEEGSEGNISISFHRRKKKGSDSQCTQRLHSLQILHKHILRCHPLCSNRQQERDNTRQSFRDERDEDGDGESDSCACLAFIDRADANSEEDNGKEDGNAGDGDDELAAGKRGYLSG